MAIINVTATNTIVFTQLASDSGNRNPDYTGLMGSPQGVLGGFNLLPGRDELYDYTSQLGQEITEQGTLAVGLFGVDALEPSSELTSQLAISSSIPGESFMLGLDIPTAVIVEVVLTAENTISFSQSLVDIIKVKPRTASNTLSFTQTNLRQGSWSPTASNTLSLTQTNFVLVPKKLTASNAVAFSQNTSPGLISRTASSQITFTQSGSSGGIFELTASSSISFTQSSSSGLISRTASNSLVFSQSSSGGVGLVSAIVLTASNTLVFSQTNNRVIVLVGAIPLTADNTLTFTQRAIFPIVLTASDTISFTQATLSNVGKSVTQTIEFTQTVVANVWRSLTASNTIAFKHGFSAVQFRDGVPVRGNEGCDATRLYAPYSGGDTPVIRPVVPAMERKTDVVFYTPIGPFCTATESLTLRTPNFGDRDRSKLARINRESRGGSLTIFRDPKWPKERTLVMDFSGIKDSEVDSVIAFLDNTLGQQISFRDWNNRVWTGFITNPDSAITRTGVNRNDIALEMEVTQSGLELNACNTIVFTQSNDREVV